MSATLSPCGLYRYRLERQISDAPLVAAFIMVNPSTADATQDDATIRKVIGFCERNHFGRVIVGNKFAFRATDVRELRRATDPKGPDNDAHLRQIVSEADAVIFAWGPLAKLPASLRRRWRTVLQIAQDAGRTPMCLGTAMDRHPLHPLMLPYDNALAPWKPPL